MAAVWQGLGGARGRRRSHQMLTEEPESPEPGPRDAPRSRLPLAVLGANLGIGPSWEPLASVAQKVPKSCQGGGQKREAGRAPGGSRRSARLSAAPSPSSGARRSQGSGLRKLSRWITKDPLLPLRRRSQREAALRSPYSSPAPLCSTRGGCLEEEEGEEEPVATSIQRLKRLSRAFDEAIASDERKQAIAHYRLLMAHNLRAVRQSERRPWASGWRHARGLAGRGHQR